MGLPRIQTLIFLKLAVAGHLTLFVARSRQPFFRPPYPSRTLLWSAVATKAAATLFVIYPSGLITPISWPDASLVWIYCLVWIFIEDQAKLAVCRRLGRKAGPAPVRVRATA